MSAKSTGASALHAFNEAVCNLETAHEALDWCTFLFMEIHDKSKLDLSGGNVPLSVRLNDINKLSGIGRYLSTEFESFIDDKITEAKAALDGSANTPEGGAS